MPQVNSEFIERYQILLEKDPSSKVFAPLAEAYRKLKLYKQAIEICERGIEKNPDFTPGFIAYSRVLSEKNEIEKARDLLLKACNLSNENLLAHELLAECELKLKQPKRALKAYKMVLFLNPLHERAQTAIKKLESLTADEYDDDIFSMEKLNFAAEKITEDINSDELEIEDSPVLEESSDSIVERYVSLVDAYIARKDFAKAKEALTNAEKQLGALPEITKRRQYVKNIPDSKTQENPEPIRPLPKKEAQPSNTQKLTILKTLLQNLEKQL